MYVTFFDEESPPCKYEILKSGLENNLDGKVLLANGVKINNFVNTTNKYETRLRWIQNITVYGIPTIFIIFSILYFSMGTFLNYRKI